MKNKINKRKKRERHNALRSIFETATKRGAIVCQSLNKAIELEDDYLLKLLSSIQQVRLALVENLTLACIQRFFDIEASYNEDGDLVFKDDVIDKPSPQDIAMIQMQILNIFSFQAEKSSSILLDEITKQVKDNKYLNVAPKKLEPTELQENT